MLWYHSSKTRTVWYILAEAFVSMSAKFVDIGFVVMRCALVKMLAAVGLTGGTRPSRLVCPNCSRIVFYGAIFRNAIFVVVRLFTESNLYKFGACKCADYGVEFTRKKFNWRLDYAAICFKISRLSRPRFRWKWPPRGGWSVGASWPLDVMLCLCAQAWTSGHQRTSNCWLWDVRLC